MPASALFYGGATEAYPKWIATSTNNWETAANWSGGVLPGASLDAVVNASGTQQPALYQDTSVLGVDIRAAGQTVNLNGHTLSLGNGGLQIVGGASPTSKIDTGSGNLVLNYTGSSPLQMVEGWIKSGGGTKSGGIDYDWNGTGGITTSAITGAAKQYESLGLRDNGFALANRPAMTQVDGVPVAADSVAVKYTWMGDMDLDGKVTVQDYNEFIHYYFNPPPTADITWMTGDFNYDGKISVQDYNMLIQGYFYAQSRGTLERRRADPRAGPAGGDRHCPGA